MAMRFKDIRKYLNEHNYTYSESENGQHLILPACNFDSDKHSNFFDYEEPYKEPHCYTHDTVLKELLTIGVMNFIVRKKQKLFGLTNFGTGWMLNF